MGEGNINLALILKFHVFVVNPDLTVESRPATVNRSPSGESVLTAHHPLYHSCDLYLPGVFQGKNQPSVP
jgi:hypothetical protein